MRSLSWIEAELTRLLKAKKYQGVSGAEDQLNEGPVDWETDQNGSQLVFKHIKGKFDSIWFSSLPLRDMMETTKELLKLDALIGKNPFERTLPKVGA